jgi:hypothetical protein
VGAQAEWVPTHWVWPTFGIGFLPGPYVKVISAIAGAAGADENAQKLIEDSIDHSLALSLLLRSRPFLRLGLFAETGIMVYTLGGGVDARDVLGEFGVDVPACPARRSDCDVPVSTTLWMVPVGLGWRFWPHPRWSVDVDGAYLFLVHSHTGTDASRDTPRLDDELDTFMRDDIYGPYFYAGWIGSTVTYHFGG